MRELKTWTGCRVAAIARCDRRALALWIALLPLPFRGEADVPVDPRLPTYAPVRPLTGKISATGDDDMEALMDSWEMLFKKTQPGVEVRLDVSSSAKAAPALAAGAEIAFVGRKLLENELAIVTKAWGYPPTPIVVGGGSYDDKNMTHAELVWVHPANPIQGLTLAQLDAVFGEELRRGATRPAETWGDLGLTGEWADKPIHAFRHRSVGVTQYIQEIVLQQGPWRKTVQVLEKAKDVPPAVGADRYALGLAGLGFAKEVEVRALAIALTANEPFVAPTLANVASRSYPLSRVIYVYVKKPPGHPVTPLLREFLCIILSKDGQKIALHEGFLPLTSDWVRTERSKLD